MRLRYDRICTLHDGADELEGTQMTLEIDHVLDNLKRVCERIASGQYDDLDDLFAMTSAADLPLVVNELAEAFASMTVQVEAREFRLTEMLADLNEANRQLAEAHRKISSENEVLRDQVQRMRIEIDVSRRDKEVSEIEGTDYFQTLRSRAQEMRGRYKEKSRSSPTTD
jgi:enamine deaminase RidA (YjgF/YER057c/UK114 family)